MSAYLVNPNHINQIVSWAKQPGRTINSYNPLTKKRLPETAEDMAKCLAMANLLSVRARYEDADYFNNYLYDVTDIVGKGKDYRLTAADIYNMCCCLSYQSCEVDDWIKTDAYWLIHNIKSTAGREMASNANQKWEYEPNPKPNVDYDDYGMLVQ